MYRLGVVSPGFTLHSSWPWLYEDVTDDEAHDILITLGAANATVLAFALGIGLFVFQTATRYSIPGLRLRYPLPRYLYVMGFALLTVIGPIAVSAQPSVQFVYIALGGTVAFYVTLPVFVSWVGRDALPDTVIHTSERRVKRRWPAKKYPRRLESAREAVTAVHAATLAGDVRKAAESVLWEVADLALRCHRPWQLDVPVESDREVALDKTASDILDYLAGQAIEHGADAIDAFRIELARIAPLLVLRERCRELVFNRFTAAARKSATSAPEAAVAMVRVLTDLVSAILANHSRIIDDVDIRAAEHEETMRVSAPRRHSDWPSVERALPSGVTALPGGVLVSQYPRVAYEYLPRVAETAGELFLDVPTSPRGDELVAEIVNLLVVPANKVPPIAVLPAARTLASARDMFAHLGQGTESDMRMPSAQRRSRIDAVISVPTGLLASAQHRGVLHIEGRQALAALLQMADSSHVGVRDARRATKALQAAAKRHFQPDRDHRTLSGEAAVELLLKAAVGDLAEHTAHYAEAHNWTDAWRNADANELLWPVDVHGFAARYIAALDDAWHKERLKHLRKGKKNSPSRMLSDLPPSVAQWTVQKFRPDVILTALVSAWAVAVEADISRPTETKMQRRMETEKRLDKLWAAARAPDETVPAPKLTFEESAPLLYTRSLARIRLKALCDAIDSYQDTQRAWDRVKTWGACARRWMEETRGRNDAPSTDALLAPIVVNTNYEGLHRLLLASPVEARPDSYRSSFAFDWGRAFGWLSQIDRAAAHPEAQLPVASGTYCVAVTRNEATIAFQDRDSSLLLLLDEEEDEGEYEPRTLARQEPQIEVSWDADNAPRLIRDHALSDYGTCPTCWGATRGHQWSLACPECKGSGRLPANILRDMKAAVWQQLRSAKDTDGLRLISLADVRSWLASVLETAPSEAAAEPVPQILVADTMAEHAETHNVAPQQHAPAKPSDDQAGTSEGPTDNTTSDDKGARRPSSADDT